MLEFGDSGLGLTLQKFGGFKVAGVLLEGVFVKWTSFCISPGIDVQLFVSEVPFLTKAKLSCCRKGALNARETVDKTSWLTHNGT